MVTNVTSLTGNGLKDWLIQRVTAIFLAGYTLFLWGYFLSHPHMTFAVWYQLFQNPMMKIMTLMALGGLFLHAWIGIWTVTTDYLKLTVLRLFIQMSVLFLLITQFIWGMIILWGQ